MILFKRRASVIIGPKGEQGKRFNNFRVSFNITKSSESNANKGIVSLFNLNQTSRSFIEKTGNFLVLLAGFGESDDNLEILTLGDVAAEGEDKQKSKVTTEKTGPDFVTSIEVGDGEKELRDTTFNKTFNAGTFIENMINEVSESFNLSKIVKGIPRKKFNQAVTLSGSAKSILEQFANREGLEFNIQDGVLQIYPSGQPSISTAIKVTPQTGLIGSPRKREEGIEFTTLLSPKIKPGTPIVLESNFVSGTFVTRKVIHNGDTKSGTWTSQVEAL